MNPLDQYNAMPDAEKLTFLEPFVELPQIRIAWQQYLRHHLPDETLPTQPMPYIDQAARLRAMVNAGGR